jgi:hypothetical protein
LSKEFEIIIIEEEERGGGEASNVEEDVNVVFVRDRGTITMDAEADIPSRVLGPTITLDDNNNDNDDDDDVDEEELRRQRVTLRMNAYEAGFPPRRILGPMITVDTSSSDDEYEAEE